MQTVIHKLTNYQPRYNLPAKTSSKRHESNLLFSFVRVYNAYLSSKNSKRKYLFAREIDLNGYGIADLLLFEYANHNRTTVDQRKRGYITTFEIKIRDWKKALKQAIRYRYYSNRVIVVLPKENIRSAKREISLFKDLNVGLWSFEKKEDRMYKLYTPRFHKPLNYDAKAKALFKLYKKFKSL